MRVPYFFWISWRYLLARLRQTALTVTGVALGVAIVAIMQSYMGGLLDYFITRSLQSTPHVTVTQISPGLPDPAGPVRRALRAWGNPVIGVTQLPVPEDEEELENPAQAERIIATIPGVQAISPFVNGQGIILNGDQREPVSFLGIRPEVETQVTDLESQFIEGTPEDLAETANGIVLGAVLAANVSVEVGDRVTVISQEGIARPFRVVGLYSSQLRDVDEVRAIMNLREAQLLTDTRGISGIGVKTASLTDVNDVAQAIEQRTPYNAETWREINAGTLDLFTTISMIIYLVVAFTMVVAGFGIANTLILTVNEKRRDIGVLKALGVPASHITLLFVGIGVLVAVFGIILGVILAWIGITVLANTPIPIDEGAGAFDVQNFPVLRVPRVYIVSAVFGFVISVLSSILPSRRAAKADPIQVIRGAE